MTRRICMSLAAFAAVFVSVPAFAETTVTGSNPIPEGETLVFDVPSGETYTCSEVLSGDGGVRKTGAGKLILSGANTYAGGFELAADILDNPSVVTLLKRHAGAAYVIAVNGTPETVKADVQIPGVAEKGEALWENRAVSAPKGVLSETFAPLAVHVYRFAHEGK